MVLSSLAVNQGISDITEEHIIAWANRKVSSHHFISLYNYNAVLEYEVHIITLLTINNYLSILISYIFLPSATHHVTRWHHLGKHPP